MRPLGLLADRFSVVSVDVPEGTAHHRRHDIGVRLSFVGIDGFNGLVDFRFGGT